MEVTNLILIDDKNVVILNYNKSSFILAILPHGLLSIGNKINIIKYSIDYIFNIKYVIIEKFTKEIEENDADTDADNSIIQQFNQEKGVIIEPVLDDLSFSYKGIITDIKKINPELSIITIDNSLACIVSESTRFNLSDNVILDNLNVNETLKDKFNVEINLAFQCPIFNGKILMIFQDGFLMTLSNINTTIIHLYNHLKTGECCFNQLFPKRITIEEFKKKKKMEVEMEAIKRGKDAKEEKENNINNSSFPIPSLQTQSSSEPFILFGELRYSKTTGNLLFIDNTSFVEVILQGKPYEHIQECTGLISNPSLVSIQLSRYQHCHLQDISINVDTFTTDKNKDYYIEKNYLSLNIDNLYHVSDIIQGRNIPDLQNGSLAIITKSYNPSVDEFQFEKGTVSMSIKLELKISCHLDDGEIKRISKNDAIYKITIPVSDHVKMKRPMDNDNVIVSTVNGKINLNRVDIRMDTELVKGKFIKVGDSLFVSPPVFEYLNQCRHRQEEELRKIKILPNMNFINTLDGDDRQNYSPSANASFSSLPQSFYAIIRNKRVQSTLSLPLASLEKKRKRNDNNDKKSFHSIPSLGSLPHSSLKISKYYFNAFSIGLPDISDILVFDLEHSLVNVKVYYPISGRWLFPFEINVGDVCLFRDFVVMKRNDQDFNGNYNHEYDNLDFHDDQNDQDCNTVTLMATSSSVIRKVSTVNDLKALPLSSLQSSLLSNLSSLSSPSFSTLPVFCYIKDFATMTFKPLQVYQIKARLLKIIHFELKALCKLCGLEIKKETCMIHGRINERTATEAETEIKAEIQNRKVDIKANVVLEIWDRTLEAKLIINNYNHILSMFLLEPDKQSYWTRSLISCGSFEFNEKEFLSAQNDLSLPSSSEDADKNKMNLDILEISHLYKLWNINVQVVNSNIKNQASSFPHSHYNNGNSPSPILKLINLTPTDCLVECRKYMSMMDI